MKDSREAWPCCAAAFSVEVLSHWRAKEDKNFVWGPNVWFIPLRWSWALCIIISCLRMSLCFCFRHMIYFFFRPFLWPAGQRLLMLLRADGCAQRSPRAVTSPLGGCGLWGWWELEPKFVPEKVCFWLNFFLSQFFYFWWFEGVGWSTRGIGCLIRSVISECYIW